MYFLYFYILLITALLVIAGLVAAIVYYRRKLKRCKTALVRCINENIEMKDKLLGRNMAYNSYTAEITPREFTNIIHNMLKKVLFLPVFSLAVLCPAVAQQKADTTYTFRFVAQKDMFYVPWRGNGEELTRLQECVESNKPDILGGRLPVYVEGYCHSMPTEPENLAVAKIRSNRVKSEIIVRTGIKEESFVTRNHASEGDYVTVRIKVPAAPSNLPPKGEAQVTPDTMRQDKSDKADIIKVEETPAEEAQATSVALGQSTNSETGQSVTRSLPLTGEVGGGFSLRANLLRWATLSPDLGLEWRISPAWGVLVNGSWTSWSWNDKDRRYALWEVMPEVRYYLGEKKAWYVGAMFKAGEFNYKLSDTGKQGDLIGGGITGGCQLRLNKALSLDFGIGLGYLNADYEKYEVIDGVRVRAGEDSKDWWGPINAGVTLVWKLWR